MPLPRGDNRADPPLNIPGSWDWLPWPAGAAELPESGAGLAIARERKQAMRFSARPQRRCPAVLPGFVLFLLPVLPGLGSPAFRVAGAEAEAANGPSKEERQLERRIIALVGQAAQLAGKGDHAAACKLLEQAMPMLQRLFPRTKYPQGHPTLVTMFGALGRWSQLAGDTARALDCYQQALAMNQRLYPADKYPQGHPLLAGNLTLLGSFLRDQRQYARARRYFEQALAAYERLYPATRYPRGHPDLARSLNTLSALLRDLGEHERALDHGKKAVAMRERLYPTEKYPQGHPDLAMSLGNLGVLLHDLGEHTQAREYLQRALAMRQRLYPRGHPDVAISLNNLASLLRDQGDYTHALDYAQEALAMVERLYPRAKYPDGHAYLALCLNNLGVLLDYQGEFARALEYHRRALAMRERLYPRKQYPQGHRVLAHSLNNLGALLHSQGQYGAAQTYCERAVAMFVRIYPRARYPQGHPELIGGLNNLAAVLHSRTDYPRARVCYEQTLEMYERLYPRARYPNGHISLALCLNNLGTLLQDQGDYARARGYYERALAMFKQLYPGTTSLPGHPRLAKCLNNLGSLRHAQGDYGAALGHLKQALSMRQAWADLFLAAASEAEGISQAASLPLTRDALLSVTRHLPGTEETTYRLVWRTRAAITQLLARRHQAVMQVLGASGQLPADQRAQARQVCQRLLTARRSLSRLLLSPGRNPGGHRQRLQQLSQEKVDLERQLARLVPSFRRRQALLRLDHTALVQKLPPGTVFIDLLRYLRFDFDASRRGKAGERRTACYVAFVLRPGQPVRRVELGRAAPVEQALAAWRADISKQQMSSSAGQVRRRVWEPLARHLPPNTRTIVLAPDSALTRLPWAALPGTRQGLVLLDDYALAVVPHGPFLLEQLSAQPRSGPEEAGLLVAVGAVNYQARPQAGAGMEAVAVLRSALRGNRQVVWPDLPGTRQELDRLIERAGKRPVHQWTGAAASTSRLLAELPKARWVHLATHGFFADARFRSVLQIDEKLFDRRAFWEGPPPGARNPLVLSGLVLAGSNRPPPADLKERTENDGGILTAEAIAGLPLQQLELAVLSACETGLGRVGVAGGEGVFGLQRAFHLAGARSVVASLWMVDDRATGVLMEEFYRNLWDRKLPKLEALRQAQLALLHGYDPVRGRLRGAGRPIAVDPRDLASAPEGRRGRPRLPPFYWAAWILSGDPGDLQPGPGARATAPTHLPAAAGTGPRTAVATLAALVLLLAALAYRHPRRHQRLSGFSG
jgi:CHAT domain-containing protein/tetratricopeptide (TPR) repeat protein